MIYSELYLFIMNRLVTSAGKLNDVIKHYDWFNHQYEVERENNENPFNRPAVFFELMPMPKQTLGSRRQSAVIRFRLHVVSDMYQELNSNATPDERNRGLEHMNLLDQIFYWLQNYTNGTTIGSINLEEMTADHNYDNLIIHILEFRTRMIDDAAVHATTIVTPDPVIIKHSI